MVRTNDGEKESNSGCIKWLIAVGFLAVIVLLVIGFFILDAVIGRQ